LTPLNRPSAATSFSGIMSFAPPIDGAGNAPHARGRHVVLMRPRTGSPVLATSYLEELLRNKIRQKTLFNRREIATKLTQSRKLEAQAGPLQSHDIAMFTFQDRL
jgi:hypothetical protein